MIPELSHLLFQEKSNCDCQCHPDPSRSKVGTIQVFARNKGPIENFSYDLFPIDEVHKIGILDLRILNLDRNMCNILVQKTTSSNLAESFDEEWKLVPIDHGLSIPDTLEVNSFELAWMSFPQSFEPFSKKSLDYINELDIIADIKMLEQAFPFRSVCLRNMRISQTLLKLGANNGLTLA